MSAKTAVILGMSVGSIVGGYIPTFFGASIFSFASIISSALGGILGIWIGYKISSY